MRVAAAWLLALALLATACAAARPPAPVESDERPVGRVDPRYVADAAP